MGEKREIEDGMQRRAKVAWARSTALIIPFTLYYIYIYIYHSIPYRHSDNHMSDYTQNTRFESIEILLASVSHT